MGPEGQLGKLDALTNALKFYKTHILKDAITPEQAKVDLILTAVQGWKSTLRKQKRKVRAQRIEELSNEGLSLKEVNQLIECRQMWADFDSICHESRNGENMTDNELDLCSVMLATNLLYKSWQRPGTVCNATLDELKAAKLVCQDGKTVVIISVAEHKTGREGHAKLLLDLDNYEHLQKYLKYVRPLQDPRHTMPYMIIMTGPKKLDRMARLIKHKLGNRYGLVLPTATRVRKIGSTTVALNVGGGADATMIHRLLSHTPKTDELHYQAIVGDSHSARAFTSMEALRQKEMEIEPVGQIAKSDIRKRIPFTPRELDAITKDLKKTIKRVSHHL